MGSSGRSLILVAAVIVIAAGIKAAEDLMVPFLLASFIATIAATPVFYLEKRKVPAALAIFIVMLGMVTVLSAIAVLLAQSGSEFTARLPFSICATLDRETPRVGAISACVSPRDFLAPRRTWPMPFALVVMGPPRNAVLT